MKISKLYVLLGNMEPLKASACCSTDALTIFQKQSATAKLRLCVVH
jgi:hypothetical protein